MTALENQVTILLGLTGTLNVLEAIEHVKTLKHLLATTEQQRKDWADMCIKKQKLIDDFKEREEFLNETILEYKSDYESLNDCLTKILSITDNSTVKELINDTTVHLCANMK